MKRIIYKYIQPYLSKPFASPPSDHLLDVNTFTAGYFKSFGNENPDKIFYVIHCRLGGSGFFSNFSNVICHIDIAKQLGMEPVVDMQNFKTFYNEQGLINGTANAWEYYFKPVSQYTLDEIYRSKNVFFSSGYYPRNYSLYITKEPQLQHILKNQISFTNAVIERINKYTEKISGKVLGLHFRGQEQKIALSHPFPPTEKQMLKYVKQILAKHQIEKIFIVTEHEPYLELFVKHYGDKVIYTDSYRTRGKNAYKERPRENHNYLLGLEILADGYLLSKCTGLLCGESNVSEFAKFVNPGAYDFCYTIINGDNSASPLLARFLYGIKKHTGRLNDELIDGMEKIDELND